MSSRFEYRPLVLALLALHSAPSLAQEAAVAAPEAAAPVTPEPVAAPVATPANAAPATELQTVTVKAQAEAPYKADTVSSPKFTQPLVDTPQTITVIKKEVLQEQGAVTLMEALRNTPGITMQMGENGNTSQGDTFQMRGFSTQSSTFVDGIRDLGAVTRDTFNLEAVEVVKGPAGADIGRGAAAGYINLVSKLPARDNASSASVMVGTADKNRITLDVNQGINETSAFRINVLQQQSGVDDRFFVQNRSVGIAPSIAFGLGTKTRVYVYGQHVSQDNVPDGGIPTIGMPGYYANPVYNHDNDSGSNATPTRRTPEGDALAAAYTKGARVDRNNFYGSAWDYEKVVADMLTAKVEADVGEASVLSNTTRFGQNRWERVITGINGPSLSRATVGTYADPVNLTGFTPGTDNPNNPATWTVSRSVQGTDQVNEIIANSTNLATSFKTGSIQHDLTTGMELAIESQRTNTMGGGSAPAANLYKPYAYDAFVKPKLTGAYSEGETTTAALYVFDTLKILESLQLTGGVRVEHYVTESDALTEVTSSNASQYPGYAVGKLAPTSLKKNDNLVSWKAGAVYKPADIGSVYVAYATSQTPPGSANFSLNASPDNINNPNFDPQETTNIEIGTKWDLLSNRLALTAALYRTENSNELTQLDSVTNTYSQVGMRRVEGIELGAVGNLTEAWQISAGIATMDTEIEEGTTGNNAAGAPTRWSPELTATLWTTYALTTDFTVGGGARYVSEQKRVVDPSASYATSNMPVIPDYWVMDAMASYRLKQNLTVRGNIYNVLDKEYISVLNNGGSRMTLGTPVSASVSLDFQF